MLVKPSFALVWPNLLSSAMLILNDFMYLITFNPHVLWTSPLSVCAWDSRWSLKPSSPPYFSFVTGGPSEEQTWVERIYPINVQRTERRTVQQIFLFNWRIFNFDELLVALGRIASDHLRNNRRDPDIQIQIGLRNLLMYILDIGNGFFRWCTDVFGMARRWYRRCIDFGYPLLYVEIAVSTNFCISGKYTNSI